MATPGTTPLLTPEEPVASKEFQQRQADFKRHEEQAWIDAQTSSDDFDKSLLTYSSGALGISLVFLKDHPGSTVLMLWVLFASWISFAFCMVLTIVSFRLSIPAQYMDLERKKQAIFDEKPFEQSWLSKAIGYSSYVALFAFIVGLVLTLVFVVATLSK